MSDPDCVFCKIVAERIPGLRVFEDESTLAFLDIGPLAESHLLVIPKAHCERLEDMDPEQLARLTGHIPRLARAVMKVTSAAAYNLLQNNGTEAGQVVPHVHFHIIPRCSGDGLGYRWNASTYKEGRAESLQAQLQAALQS